VACTQEQKSRTSTTIDKLDEKQRMNGVARMLGGSAITETALKHAREMIGG
jgi:DNA repair ATPase RecN